MQVISELKKWLQVNLTNISSFSAVLVPVTHIMWKKMSFHVFCDASDVDANAFGIIGGRASAFVSFFFFLMDTGPAWRKFI